MHAETVRRIMDIAQEGIPCVVVSVIKRSGSTPAPLHGVLIVLREETVGTVGGGALEAEAIRAARETLTTNLPIILSQELSAEEASEEGMLCGGQVTFLMEPVQNNCLDAWRSALNDIQKHKSGAFVTTITKSLSKVEIVRHWVDLEEADRNEREAAVVRRTIATGRPQTISAGNATIVVDPVIVPDDLLIFGAGHLAQALVPLASSIGFSCHVIDDRDTFASRTRFPDASNIVVADPTKAVAALPHGSHVWSVIVTRGHMDDARVLRQLLNREYRYIGMVGSSRKKRIIWDSLIKEGIGEADLRAVHCPIGLPIGGTTPAEIALSIAAELLACRNGPASVPEKP